MAGETAVLEVKFAGNGLTGLYPWDLVLEEGFSRLYRAELTALSSQKHTAEELAAAVDNGISVIIREKLVTSAVYRVRYLHGIVTAAINKGVFCSASKSDCYTYVFVIEPELARLKYTRHTAPFYKMRPAAITEKILSDYKIDVQVKDDYISRGKFGKNLMFNQFNISDLDFIDGITRLYGISYVFTHPAVSGGKLGRIELYLSSGEKFPASDFSCSDRRKEGEALQFDFLSADEGSSLWRMEKFSVTGGIGIDGFKVNAVYPACNYGSDQWKEGETGVGDRCVNYTSLFHGYDVEADTTEVDGDIKLILDAKTRAADIAKTRMEGAAQNIAVRPGIILELRHFYGKNDGAVITALVTGIKLHRRARWPSDLAVRAEGADGEISDVQFSGIDWGKNAVKRFCPQAK